MYFSDGVLGNYLNQLVRRTRCITLNKPKHRISLLRLLLKPIKMLFSIEMDPAPIINQKG